MTEKVKRQSKISPSKTEVSKKTQGTHFSRFHIRTVSKKG